MPLKNPVNIRSVILTGFSDSGDGGIRTRVPRRANAFRVRPVMTTSIRLHKTLVKYTIFCAFCKIINKNCNKIKISLQKCKRMCYTYSLRGMA